MEAHICNHPKVPHTVEYHIGGGKPETVSVSSEFKDLEEADIFAQKIIRQTTGRLSWLKVFRSDNDSYVCFRWDNPKSSTNIDDASSVKLEVDMDPLKEAFDNVALGFKDHGDAIRMLRWSQVFVTLLVLGDILGRIFT